MTNLKGFLFRVDDSDLIILTSEESPSHAVLVLGIVAQTIFRHMVVESRINWDEHFFHSLAGVKT